MAVAKAQGLTVQETGFFARDEPILGVGSAPEMTARAFSMNPGEVSGALRTSRGFAFEYVQVTIFVGINFCGHRGFSIEQVPPR